jgi:hypothetical protein
MKNSGENGVRKNKCTRFPKYVIGKNSASDRKHGKKYGTKLETCSCSENS